MATQHSFIEQLCFDYLTSLPIQQASRILANYDPEQPFIEFARDLVSGIPPKFFESSRPAVNGPQFVIRDGNLVFEANPNSNEEQGAWPAQTEPSLDDHSAPVGLPTRRSTRRKSLNSFMVFRCK